MHPTLMNDHKHIVVVGAGVIGLTTAIRIQEALDLASVIIVAEQFPTDPRSIKYASLWAGADHISFAGDDEHQKKLDQETFKTFWSLSEPTSEAEHCFLRLTHTTYDRDGPIPHPLTWMPDHRPLRPEELIPGSVSGEQFTTVTVDTPAYLAYLSSRFLRNGGSFVRAHVNHITDIIEGGLPTSGSSGQSITNEPDDLPSPDAVVVCVGLGARSLGGIEDQNMYPIRGQTLVVRAPWVRFDRTYTSATEVSYIIPRRCGDVIVGGIMTPNDWYPVPHPETSADILKRGFTLAPELAPPGIENPTIEDVRSLILYEGCGLRPARKGGIRLEVEWFPRSPSRHSEEREDEKVPVVYNYGHGGYGYQSSWGSASEALGLLISALGVSSK